MREVKLEPPSELTRCRAPVEGLPADVVATLPPSMRAGIIRMARELGATTDQLNRLIAWHTGEACETP